MYFHHSRIRDENLVTDNQVFVMPPHENEVTSVVLIQHFLVVAFCYWTRPWTVCIVVSDISRCKMRYFITRQTVYYTNFKEMHFFPHIRIAYNLMVFVLTVEICAFLGVVSV